MEIDANESSRETDKVRLIEALGRVKGPMIEIGGPTPPTKSHPDSYKLIGLSELPKKLWILNICLSHKDEVWDPETKTAQSVKYSSPDIQADGMKLPFDKDSVGAVLVSALYYEIRGQVLREIHRVLEPGGLVIWQFGLPRDIKKARQVGLIKIGGLEESGNHDYVFKKPIPMKDSQSREL